VSTAYTLAEQITYQPPRCPKCGAAAIVEWVDVTSATARDVPVAMPRLACSAECWTHTGAAGQFICPACGCGTPNANDIANSYCPCCHWQTGDPLLGPHQPNPPGCDRLGDQGNQA
jgi:hypothetical protein